MSKLWQGRTSAELDKTVNDFNASISVDKRLYKEDIEGSIAHVTMLGATGIIPEAESREIAAGLEGILTDIQSGKLAVSEEAEDIHSFVEGELTARLGDLGKKLHTARSRNDQVATDMRLYVKKEIDAISALLSALVDTLDKKALDNLDAVMPGYTHLQRAQPVTYAHVLRAYKEMLLRDISRLSDCKKRMDYSPLGSAALAGTGYPIDRNQVAKLLGFAGITANSIDGVSDRDYCVELLSAISLIMTHLSRFSEEIILYASWEFKFLELSDAYSTGSSIMPQKKNPDIAELVRGKSGRVFGDLIAMLTVLKGLPLAYNKDMQEDKEAVFDAIDTVKVSLTVFIPMIKTAEVNKTNMLHAAAKGFINATDVADYLTNKGVPFRTAYKISGGLVAEAIKEGKTLEELPFEAYYAASSVFDKDIYSYIDMKACLKRRTSDGGAGQSAD